MLGHGSGGDAGCLDRFGAGYTLNEVGDGVRVARARGVDLTVDRDGGNMLGRLGRDHPRALRAEREEHFGHAQPLQRLRLRASDERLGLLVPKEMRTEWRNFSGTAKYSNYRRFEVRTTEVPDLTTIKP